MASKLKFIFASTVLAAAAAHAAVPLPALTIDPNEVSVSGLSSGGFMAVQMHVAYSATFRKGAGIVAGGPFYCAEGSIVNATGRCMAHSTSIPVASLVGSTNSWAASGFIDPVANLNTSKLYLFSGTSDNTVRPAVMNDLKTYYASFVPAANMVYKNTIGAGHAMVTDDYGSACSTTASPYINNCGFDLAGEILKHIHGPLNARNNGTLSGSFSEFTQSSFVTGHGMATTGWVYVPASCAAGVACKLHVVFHGCKQNTTAIAQQYVRNTGYNRWADSNNMVVLYPQTGAGATNGCWDWWGYDSANYSKQSGPQMAAVKAMVTQLSSAGTVPPTLPAPTGLGTSGATVNSMSLAWAGVTGASGYNAYRAGSKVNTSLISATTYTDTGLATGTSYSWTVKAVDAGGIESPASTAATGTTTGTAPPSATCFTASNYAHTSVGRAYQSAGYARANGSNQNMGLWNVFIATTLKRTATNHYVIGTCP